MKQQLDNALTSSFLLFVDHEIQKQGQAHYPANGLFYKDEDEVQGLYTYTCSYKQLCNDTSISGANVMSGVYVNGIYTRVGSGGLVNINHYDGSITFDHLLPKNTLVSGNFSVKEFSVYLSDQPDYSVIMDSKYRQNPKYAQQATGLSQDTKTFPAVILVPMEQEARALAMGGLDDNYMRMRTLVICENLYQRVAVCNILKNFRLRNLPIFSSLPFDFMGNMTGVNYNFSNLPIASGLQPFIQNAKTTLIPQGQTFLDATKQFAMVDFDVSAWGGHQ